VGAVGWSIPTALGIAAARRGRVLALCGDHAMHCQEELATAVRYRLPVIYLVDNNSAMNIVASGMGLHGRSTVDLEFPPTDFAAIARAKGALGVRVTTEGELEAALRRAVKGTRPVLIDAVTQRVPPPLGARGEKR
jgi:thiamine pyrophosphate-dependent acetolactate synthase large subunit-like protein